MNILDPNVSDYIFYPNKIGLDRNASYSVMLEAGINKKTAQKAMKKAYKYFDYIKAI